MSIVKWSKIILFGDSQIQRSFDPNHGLWGTLLANRFQRICDVIPRGFSGYSSRSGRTVMPHVFPENISNVEAFIIVFGSNDLGGDESYPNHVPIAEYLDNLQEMIKYAQKIGVNKDKIILLTPAAYCDKKFMKWCEELGVTFPKRKGEVVAKYAKECENMSKQLGIDVINLYEEMMKDEDWPKYLLDGLHFSREGSFLVYNLLMQILEKRINVSELNMPYWRDLNHIHPENATHDLFLQKCPSHYFPVEK